MSARTSAPTRFVLCPTVVMLRSGRLEFQRGTIDAIAQVRRWRPVIENMAEMAAATAAMHLVANHAMAAVGVSFDSAGDRIIEARPARPAFEFHLGDKQGLIAGGTPKGAGAFLVQQRATSRHLGAVLAHDRVLFGREQLAPLGFGMCDRILLGHD